MKTISLWQPWATAIALGAKHIETRSWSTPYRGPIAIHAAKRRSISELTFLLSQPVWQAILAPFGGDRDVRELSRWLPYGAIIAIANLSDCRPAETFWGGICTDLRDRAQQYGTRVGKSWSEYQLGDFTRGRFGWLLENVIRLDAPLIWRGQRGWFDVPDDAIKAALAATERGQERSLS